MFKGGLEAHSTAKFLFLSPYCGQNHPLPFGITSGILALHSSHINSTRFIDDLCAWEIWMLCEDFPLHLRVRISNT